MNVESLVHVSGGKYINSNNGNVTTNTNSNNTSSGSNVPKPSKPSRREGLYDRPSTNRYSADYIGPKPNYDRKYQNCKDASAEDPVDLTMERTSKKISCLETP